VSAYTHSSSISDCVYNSTVSKFTAGTITLKVNSLINNYGTLKCLYKNGEKIKLTRRNIRTDIKGFKQGMKLKFRAMKYSGMSKSGKAITGQRHYLDKM